MPGTDQFFLMHLNTDGQIGSYEVVQADTNAAAMVRARGSLYSVDDAVEVWKRGQLVGRVGRNDRTNPKIAKQEGSP